MDLRSCPLDLILVPLSLFLIAGYHAYMCYNTKQPMTMMSRTWLQDILTARCEDDEEKKSMLIVQSLRNSLLPTALSASTAMAINCCMAALANNVYNSGRLLEHPVFGSQEGPTLALKWASASLLLLVSFLCSSTAVWCMVEVNFLITASGEFFDGHAEKVLERGWMLAVVGNRVLYATLPFLLWLFGPLPMAFSSVAMVWVFYNLDFSGRGGGGFRKNHRL